MIAEYAATSGKTRESAAARDGQLPGDPALAVQVMIAITHVENPPLRLIPGCPMLSSGFVPSSLKFARISETRESTSVNPAYVALRGQPSGMQGRYERLGT